MVSPAPANESPFPRRPGTYLLLLHLPEQQPIRIGRLGQFNFPAGFYLYAGSAFGPGGLAGRLNRHLALATSGESPGSRRRSEQSPSWHWHIDYLSRQAQLSQIWYSLHDEKREHNWAALVQKLPGSSIPAPRFGASDCRCPAHLFHYQELPSFEAFGRLGRLHFPSDAEVQQYLP